MKIVTRAKASDVDLVVAELKGGKSDLSLLGLARLIEGSWMRIANAEYRAGPNGPSVSLIVKDGQIITHGEGRPWPVFVVTRGGVAEIRDTVGDVSLLKLAVSAGPWLVRAGQLCNIAEEIARGGYTGLRPSDACERTAIGIASGGVVIHLINTSATLDELAAEMRILGCHDAISLDGGGSACVLDKSRGVLAGQAVRYVCSGLVFKQILDDDQTGQKGDNTMKKIVVCIDPGHGGRDPGALSPDGLQEKHINLLTSLQIAEYLRRAGIEPLLTRTADVEVGLDERCTIANTKRADIFASIHANWMDKTGEDGKKLPGVPDPNISGLEVFHYPGSTKGVRLANSVATAMRIASGLQLRRLDSETYHVLKHTNMPAILVELGYLSHAVDRSLLREVSYLDKYALGIAFGIINYFNQSSL